MDLNIVILDYLIDLIEFNEVIHAKTEAVKKQEFAEAAKILERQREIEKRLLTSDQLKEYRQSLTANS